ncbi:MAG: helix-hairpin-helix domain-containing protein [Cephaloticoccus sp.]|nr:helix-hairpin-helix domain-containing protein [Cephaloticoccus sp.]
MKKIIALFVALLLSISVFASVNLNTASEKELIKLPGIGKKTATAIITEREANGAFVDLKDLAKRVDGVGKKTVEKLAEAGVTFAEEAESKE